LSATDETDEASTANVVSMRGRRLVPKKAVLSSLAPYDSSLAVTYGDRNVVDVMRGDDVLLVNVWWRLCPREDV
jgi:hypothetical protein